VWRLWEEIKSEYADTFAFHHSWGLGVVRKPGGSLSPLSELLFRTSPDVQEDVRRHYVIYASHLEHILGRMPAVPPPAKPALSPVRIEVFPRIGGSYSSETSQVREMACGEWGTLTFDLRDTNLAGPIRVDPGAEPGFIEIGDVVIHSNDSETSLWSSLQSSNQRDLHPAGTAVRHPSEPSFLMSVGDDPQILFNVPGEVRGPIKLTITLRVTPASKSAIEIVQRDFCSGLVEFPRRVSSLTRELEATRAELESSKIKLSETLDANNRLRGELDDSNAQLSQEKYRMMRVLDSLSWRITAPMRRIMEGLRSKR
jgi:hypothetical protein